MKKLVLLLLLVVLAPRPASGQVLIGILFGDKVTTEKFHLGVNIGQNLSNLSGIDGTSVRPGLLFGLLGEWQFAENFYLQPELLPFYMLGATDLPPGGLDPGYRTGPQPGGRMAASAPPIARSVRSPG